MPATYFVDFIAYVNERIRPEGFPREVHVQETYTDIESTHHLQAIVNRRFVELVTAAGLVVLKDPTGLQDQSVISFDRRIFVPWHLLTHMTLKVTLIPQLRTQDSLLPPELIPEKKPKELVN